MHDKIIEKANYERYIFKTTFFGLNCTGQNKQKKTNMHKKTKII